MQYNINVANGTGMEVRTNLNLAHQSLATNFFGATDPSLMSPVCAFPGSTWADTGNGLLKVRNADDSDWIVIGTIESDGTPKLGENAINTSELALNLRQPSTAYTVGDIAYSALLPSWAYLECIVGGTTSSGNLPVPSSVVANATFVDGTVTWTIKKVGSSNLPVGAIIQYAVNGSLPEDFLACDGGALSRTLYAKLYGKIGTTYGAGDGRTTFNLPKFTDGTFPEGASTAGTAHAAGLPNITGQSSRPVLFDNRSGVSGAFYQNDGTGTGIEIAGTMQRDLVGSIIMNASRSSPIYGASTTVQPKALTTRFIIKYQ